MRMSVSSLPSALSPCPRWRVYLARVAIYYGKSLRVEIFENSISGTLRRDVLAGLGPVVQEADRPRVEGQRLEQVRQ